MSAPCPEISHLFLAALSQANTLGGSDGTIFWNQARASLTLLQQCIRKRVVIPIDYDSDFRC